MISYQEIASVVGTLIAIKAYRNKILHKDNSVMNKQEIFWMRTKETSHCPHLYNDVIKKKQPACRLFFDLISSSN